MAWMEGLRGLERRSEHLHSLVKLSGFCFALTQTAFVITCPAIGRRLACQVVLERIVRGISR